MSYFRTQSESLHLAISDDGFGWRALNGNRPVFGSEIGSKTLRDPSIFCDNTGLFHLFSTNGWRSDAIFHAVSSDLIAWRDQKLIPVMESVPETRNCWAPEAFYARESGLYWIIWSSTTPQSGMEFDAHGYNHRIWAVSTPDFATFSGPQMFFDPGYNVIDANVLPVPEGFIMAFKDERGGHTPDAKHKAIRIARAENALGPWKIREKFVSPLFTEGPALYRVAGEWLMLFDHFTEGFFGAIATSDWEEYRDVSEEVKCPDGPRHAGVISIADEIGARLEAHFGT